MRILRNRQGNLRSLWKVLLLVGPFLAAYLLRYVPIRILADRYVVDGVPQSGAVAMARRLVMEDTAWAHMIGTVQGLLWFPLVCATVRLDDQRRCRWRDLGLASVRRGMQANTQCSRTPRVRWHS